jgi:hypothetical protein
VAIELTVAGTPYQYPENREQPGWGEEASAWAAAVTAVLESLNSPGDILTTSAVIANNQAVAADINGLQFDPAVVRAAICQYSVARTTDTNEKVECGHIYVAYKTQSGTWEYSVVGTASGGIDFSVDPSGQIKYTTDDLTGANYAGSIKFNAKASTF